MGLVTTSLRTSRAARVRERALQQGRHTRAATKTTWVAKEAMAGTSGAGDGRDGRRRGMLDEYLKETRSEGRGVETTGGARARRGMVCWFRRVDVPDPQRGDKRWHGDVAGARGALRGGRSGEKADGYSDRSDDAGTTCGGAVVNGMVLCGSVRSAVCTDGVTESATEDGNSHGGWHRPQ